MFGWEFYFVLFSIAAMIACLIWEIKSPELIITSTVVLFLLTGILTPKEAINGFSNEGVMTIGLLFIMAGAVEKSKIVESFFNRLIKDSSTTQLFLFKLLTPIASLSAFMNNTPIVITLTPIIRKWCEKHNISPSKLLIPLSYATILGGTITLMGTSTNLVVHGLLVEEGMNGFSFFQFAIIGIPITIVGLLYLIFLGYKLLPNNQGTINSTIENLREYVCEIIVGKEYAFIGKSVEEAKLRNLKGLFLVSIIRESEQITPVANTTMLKHGDRLLFSGDISTLSELQQTKGLNLLTNQGTYFLSKPQNRLVEAVVSHHSSLLYKKLKDTHFRSKFNAAVIAVHRKNHHIKTKIGEIELKPGDILLMVVGQDFYKNDHHKDFYLISPVTPNGLADKNTKRKGWVSLFLLLCMIALVTLKILSIITALGLAVVMLFLFKIITPSEARKYIQWNVLVLVASSFGIGVAILKTGVATWMADLVISSTATFGIFATILAIYFLTNLFTEVITNNAAAVIMFPIAFEVSGQMQLNPLPLAVIVAIAASASFSTPIGYQTNLIVYGPGKYSFKDYLKVGIPLNLIIMIVTVTLVYFIWIY
jgi:di/tricarboxylate transporter